MPFDTHAIGRQTEAFSHKIDARWLMAYAAALDDLNPRYFDTEQHTVVAHPLFPVCVEWPVILAARALSGDQLSDAEAARGVHAAHDLHLYRPIRDGDQLTTTATLVGAKQIRPGTAYTLQLDTCDQDSGELVARTYQLGIYRDVTCTGQAQDAAVPALPDWYSPAGGWQQPIHVAAGSAHRYTECARIWNPIHTDRAVALAAGLPDIILHGTATLALAVSRLVEEFAGASPERVYRLGGRFAAMVLIPSQLTLSARQEGDTVSFEVLTEQGETAISQGFMCLR